MARTQAPDYESQRLNILEAAAEAFAEAGYAACSMAGIAAGSGASKARLYHYYASKEAILYDLLDRHTQSLADIAADARDLALRESLSAHSELERMIALPDQELLTWATRQEPVPDAAATPLLFEMLGLPVQ